MTKLSTTQTVINELCLKLQCSELAEDFERVKYARERLTQLQQTEIFRNLHANPGKTSQNPSSASLKVSNILLETKQRLEAAQPSFISMDGSQSEENMNILEEYKLPDEEYKMEKSLESYGLSGDAWLGYFRGFEILEENQERIVNENKQCIELSLKDESNSLEHYLRAGIRCFMIDLFIGTELEKQKLIFKLRESELKVSREYGFPITTTLFAMLSPRLQYTGVMDVKSPAVELRKGSKCILTTKPKYSSQCRASKIYVNASFLIADCRKDDFILVGPSIQLTVAETLEEELKCIVMTSGILSSRLPVLFPAKCNRLQISLEELENITFAREVGINVLVSYKPGTQEYLKDLSDALNLLKCDNLRIFTRVVLNEYDGEKGNDLQWVADSYDGFYVDFSAQQYNKCSETAKEHSAEESNMLNLTPACVNFITKIYNMKKPIVLNPYLIAERQLLVQPCNTDHILYYPDKFIFSSEKYNHASSFLLSQNAMTAEIPLKKLSNSLFCDPSEVDDDAIARACVAASFELQAKAIVVCSAWPNMSIRLSHFRPKAPIIHVSAVKSIGDYISLYHHVIFMHFKTNTQHNYDEYVINAFIYCLIVLNTRNILLDGDNVLLVYGTETVTQMCDRYLVYKFNKEYFAKNLAAILFV